MDNIFDPKKIKIIVGLGNPGKAYNMTPHNAGFEFIDELKSYLSSTQDILSTQNHKNYELIKFDGITLVKPLLFMNLSGIPVASILKYSNINSNELLLAHDDLDISLGKFKIQFEKSPKGHNGVDSVEKSLGTKAFFRLRIGIDNRPEDSKIIGKSFVLSKYNKESSHLLSQTIRSIISLYF
jgi:peptidyl-tRNA hydrolase, PTH1 family